MSRNLWFMVALVLGAAAIWWAMLSEPATPDVEESAATTPAAPLAAPAPTPSPRAEAPAAPADAPSAAPPNPTPQAAAPTPPAPDPIPAPVRTGPVDELKAAFASEPRDSHATEPETVIQAAFRRPEVPHGLLKSVLCRSSVCKVETRWTPAGAAGFMGAFMNLVATPDGTPSRNFDHEIAISPEGEPDTNGERSIDVYLKRLDATP